MSELVNQVDVSDATVDAEWERIANDHSVSPELSFEGVEGVEQVAGSAPMVVQAADEVMADKVAAAEMVINSALVFVFDALGGLNIDAKQYEKVSHGWAVVIAKRFEGGIFEFMAKYKDELQAAGATILFVGIVRKAVQEKAERKKQETIEKNKAKASSGVDSSEDSRGDDHAA